MAITEKQEAFCIVYVATRDVHQYEWRLPDV